MNEPYQYCFHIECNIVKCIISLYSLSPYFVQVVNQKILIYFLSFLTPSINKLRIE